MDKITKKEEEEILRFLVLLLVIGAILVVSYASRLATWLRNSQQAQGASNRSR